MNEHQRVMRKLQVVRMAAPGVGFLSVCVALCAFIVGCMEKPAPPPPPPPPAISAQIFDAKRIFVSNSGEDPVAAANLPGGADACYDTLYASLKLWGHYQLVSSPREADLVFEVSATERAETRGFGGTGVRANVHDYTDYPAIITLAAKDTATGSTLWSTQVGFLSTANTRKTALKQFNQTIEALTDRLKAMGPTAHPATAP